MASIHAALPERSLAFSQPPRRGVRSRFFRMLRSQPEGSSNSICCAEWLRSGALFRRKVFRRKPDSVLHAYYRTNPIGSSCRITKRRPISVVPSPQPVPNEPNQEKLGTVRPPSRATWRMQNKPNVAGIAHSEDESITLPRRCLATRKNEPTVATGQRKQRRCFPPSEYFRNNPFASKPGGCSQCCR